MKTLTSRWSLTVGTASLVIMLATVAAHRVVAQPPPVEITSVVGEMPDADIKIKVKEATVLSQDHLTFQPGGSTPWHYHPGPALVVIGTGAITEHDAEGCVRVFPAGSAFFEEPGRIHRVSNETGGVAEIFGTLILPVGAPPLVPVPEPAAGNCRSDR